jgi:hypothetical protein
MIPAELQELAGKLENESRNFRAQFFGTAFWFAAIGQTGLNRLVDGVIMKRTWLGYSLTLLAFNCHTILPAADTRPPEHVSVSLWPTTLEVSESHQNILVTVRIKDDLSGMGNQMAGSFVMPGVSMTFISPSRNQQARVGFTAGHRTSGTEWDGVYTNRLLLPRYSESGWWTLQRVDLLDAARNSRSLDFSDLYRLGIYTDFLVSGTSDTNPPQFLSLGFSPDAIDAGDSNRLIQFTARLRDDLSGIGGALPDGYSTAGRAHFRSPSGNQGFSVSFSNLGRSSGDAHDGIYTNAIVLPQFCEAGNWTLDSLYAADAAGNQQQVYGGKLLALGFPMTLQVTGAGDTNAPALTSFNFWPTNINTSLSYQAIQFSVHVLDDLAGFGTLLSYFNTVGPGGVSATFASPTGRQSASIGLGPQFPTSAVTLEASFTNTLPLPRYSEPGLWLLRGLTVMDNAGNRRDLDLAAAQSLGLQYSFVVEEFPRLTVNLLNETVIISWPKTATGFRLQSSTTSSEMAAWSDVPQTPLQFEEIEFLAFPRTTEPSFYRLIKRP